MSKNFQRLWKDAATASDEAGAIRALAAILIEKEGRDFVSHLSREDAEYCIDVLGRGIAGPNLKTAEKQAFFVTLRRLSGNHGRLPDAMMITEEIEVADDILASGGFSDVRIGKYMGHRVAVKTLRVAIEDDVKKIKKQFCKEVVLWSTLSHPNILKLIGVRGDLEKGQFTTVSEWMIHGSIMDYVRKDHVNRLELLRGAAEGLKYLHHVNLTHGDLKGANVLMSNDRPPRACLADFGFMTMVLDSNQPMSCSAQLEGGTVPFMSPELLVPSKFGVKNAIPTPEADVYAFGMVIFQVLTGELPFRGVRQTELAFAVVQGRRPSKPTDASAIGLSDPLWDFLQRCWGSDMHSRPRVADVVACLTNAAASWQGLMPPSSQVGDAIEASERQESGTLDHCAIFGEPSNGIPGSPTDSQISSERTSSLGTPSTACTEPLRDELQEVDTKPSMGLPADQWGSMRRRPQEALDDLQEAQHLTYSFKPPPSAIPAQKQKPFKSLKAKLRKLLKIFH